jgi:hypothetical protein
MRQSTSVVALAVLAVSACGGDGPTESRSDPGLVFTVGAGTTDTIQASPAQPLGIRVIGADGKPASGAIVRFDAVPAEQNPQVLSMAVGTLASSGFAQTALETTDASGVASMRVRFGSAAGEGKIIVTVPELGFRDTARYTVTPGAAARTAISPRDTVVYLDGAVTLRAFVTDRFGNRRSELPTLTGPEGVSVAGSTVSISRFERHWVRATFADARADSVGVTALPRGRLAAVRGYYGNMLVMMDLDGTNRATVPFTGAIYGVDWAPDGRVVLGVAVNGSTSSLRAVNPVAVYTFLTGSTAASAEFPVFSADGRSVFFAGRAANTFNSTLWRANADGTGVQSSAIGLGTNSGTDYGIAYGPSPDGTKLVSAGTIIDLQTQARTSLSTPGAASWRWSPQGDLIAYNGSSVLGVIKPDGTGRRVLWTGTSSTDQSIDWSGDGKYLVLRGANSLALEMVEVASGTRAIVPKTSDFHQGALQ